MKLFIVVLAIFGIGLGAVSNAQVKLVRDPFAPLNPDNALLEAASQSKELRERLRDQKVRLRLTGIIWDPDEPYAIITYRGKKKILGLKGEIDGKIIEKIAQDHVLIMVKGKSVVVRVGKEVVI